ncbi:MAG: sigma 54-interacting transcriptional regulator [Proteobacteria bacterium]|nr:sigma 54-interacting transcriptional regulator [Pseudomonadota bacterium]
MEPAYRSLKELLLALAHQSAEGPCHQQIVSGLASQADVALARLWLIKPGDICEVCPRRSECPQHVPCLHLAASAGSPREDGADWSRTDGDFRRFPIGVRKIGAVGRGETLCVEEIERDATWIARPEWARREGIRGFGGAPLLFAGEVLGVLGVFTRAPFDRETLEWLEIIADHAAAALANSRAFEQIESLRRELALENEYLREEVTEAKASGEIVGQSSALARVLERIELVAPTDATVLIDGESGTGKELVAREIHRRSGRADRPLIQVNCAAIPRELYESEFFGHAKGAFTGATADREGRFAAADGGTLFLDEVGEIPLELQGKLLRVLQEGCYERVGEERTREVDVRVIAATNRDLRADIDTGRFREDLYYRLDVFPIQVAPLRERRADIAPLAAHLLERAARRMGRDVPRMPRETREALEAYDWPGNVRELANVIERAVITWRGGPLRVDVGLPAGSAGSTGSASRAKRAPSASGEDEILTEAQLLDLERENLHRALRRTRWKIGGADGAAELLGIRPTTLTSRLKKLGIERPL